MSLYRDKAMEDLFSQDDRVLHCNSCGMYIEGNDLLIYSAASSGKCPYCGSLGVHEVEYVGDDDFEDEIWDEI